MAKEFYLSVKNIGSNSETFRNERSQSFFSFNVAAVIIYYLLF